MRADYGNVVLFIGPNGAGKTTTARGVAQHLQQVGAAAVVVSIEILHRAVVGWACRDSVSRGSGPMRRRRLRSYRSSELVALARQAGMHIGPDGDLCRGAGQLLPDPCSNRASAVAVAKWRGDRLVGEYVRTLVAEFAAGYDGIVLVDGRFRQDFPEAWLTMCLGVSPRVAALRARRSQRAVRRRDRQDWRARGSLRLPQDLSEGFGILDTDPLSPEQACAVVLQWMYGHMGLAMEAV